LPLLEIAQIDEALTYPLVRIAPAGELETVVQFLWQIVAFPLT
jgi:hypothetical protein